MVAYLAWGLWEAGVGGVGQMQLVRIQARVSNGEHWIDRSTLAVLMLLSSRCRSAGCVGLRSWRASAMSTLRSSTSSEKPSADNRSSFAV